MWFNALPSYVGDKPLWFWAYDPVGFFNAKSIYACPTAFALGIAPQDATPTTDGTRDMDPKLRPLFNYGMNSKSLANEQINNVNAVLKSPMIAHPSNFVLFSDVPLSFGRNALYWHRDNRMHPGDAALLHDAFFLAAQQRRQHHVQRRSCGLFQIYRYRRRWQAHRASPPAKIPAIRRSIGTPTV